MVQAQETEILEERLEGKACSEAKKSATCRQQRTSLCDPQAHYISTNKTT